MKTIKVSQDYFLKHLVERLKAMEKKIGGVDRLLYGKEEYFNEWEKIRSISLELDELIKALREYEH